MRAWEGVAEWLVRRALQARARAALAVDAIGEATRFPRPVVELVLASAGPLHAADTVECDESDTGPSTIARLVVDYAAHPLDLVPAVRASVAAEAARVRAGRRVDGAKGQPAPLDRAFLPAQMARTLKLCRFIESTARRWLDSSRRRPCGTWCAGPRGRLRRARACTTATGRPTPTHDYISFWSHVAASAELPDLRTRPYPEADAFAREFEHKARALPNDLRGAFDVLAKNVYEAVRPGESVAEFARERMSAPVPESALSAWGDRSAAYVARIGWPNDETRLARHDARARRARVRVRAAARQPGGQAPGSARDHRCWRRRRRRL